MGTNSFRSGAIGALGAALTFWGLTTLYPPTGHCQTGICTQERCFTDAECGPMCVCEGARIVPPPPAAPDAQTGPTIEFGDCRRLPGPSPQFPEHPIPFDPNHPGPAAPQET